MILGLQVCLQQKCQRIWMRHTDHDLDDQVRFGPGVCVCACTADKLTKRLASIRGLLSLPPLWPQNGGMLGFRWVVVCGRLDTGLVGTTLATFSLVLSCLCACGHLWSCLGENVLDKQKCQVIDFYFYHRTLVAHNLNHGGPLSLLLNLEVS